MSAHTGWIKFLFIPGMMPIPSYRISSELYRRASESGWEISMQLHYFTPGFRTITLLKMSNRRIFGYLLDNGIIRRVSEYPACALIYPLLRYLSPLETEEEAIQNEVGQLFVENLNVRLLPATSICSPEVTTILTCRHSSTPPALFC
jgi:hypothetical protein